MEFLLTLNHNTATQLLYHLRYDGVTSQWTRYTSKHFFGLIVRSEVPLEDITSDRVFRAKLHKKLSKKSDGSSYVSGWTIDITDDADAFTTLPEVDIQISTHSGKLLAIQEPILAALFCQDAKGGSIGMVLFREANSR